MLSRFYLIPDNGQTDRQTDRRTDLLSISRVSMLTRDLNEVERTTETSLRTYSDNVA